MLLYCTHAVVLKLCWWFSCAAADRVALHARRVSHFSAHVIAAGVCWLAYWLPRLQILHFFFILLFLFNWCISIDTAIIVQRGFNKIYFFFVFCVIIVVKHGNNNLKFCYRNKKYGNKNWNRSMSIANFSQWS